MCKVTVLCYLYSSTLITTDIEFDLQFKIHFVCSHSWYNIGQTVMELKLILMCWLSKTYQIPLLVHKNRLYFNFHNSTHLCSLRHLPQLPCRPASCRPASPLQLQTIVKMSHSGYHAVSPGPEHTVMELNNNEIQCLTLLWGRVLRPETVIVCLRERQKRTVKKRNRDIL